MGKTYNKSWSIHSMEFNAFQICTTGRLNQLLNRWDRVDSFTVMGSFFKITYHRCRAELKSRKYLARLSVHMEMKYNELYGRVRNADFTIR